MHGTGKLLRSLAMVDDVKMVGGVISVSEMQVCS